MQYTQRNGVKECSLITEGDFRFFPKVHCRLLTANTSNYVSNDEEIFKILHYF